MALAAKTGVGGKGPKDEDSEGGGGLMPPAELRAALKKADTRGKPSSCVVGLTRDKQAVILVDHLPKPRKLLAQVKGQGQAGGLDLDVPSLRFGRVSVSGRQVDITVNKAVAPALELKLRPVMRGAGHPVFTINADPAIEDEPEDGAEGGTSQETPGQVQNPGAPPVASPTPGPSADNPPRVRPGPAAPAAAQAPGTGGNGAAPNATDAAGRAALLAAVPPDVAAGVRASLSAAPGRKGELAGLLAQVRAGVDGGNQAAAEAGIATLREAVGAAAPPPVAAPPAAPDRARDASPRPGARDAAAAPPLAVPGPPALAADAGLSRLARAWDADQARARQGAGQVGAAPDGAPPAAGQPPPSPPQPTSGAAQRAPGPAQVRADVAAMMGGVDRRQAEGAGGGVQVAQAGPPGAAAATDAGGPGPAEREGMTHWGSLPRPGSQPVPGAVRPARDWRPLQGVGQVALGAAGLAVGGALSAVGASEVGLGVATTPLGVGVPITGVGVATVGLGLAVTGGGAATAYEGMGNILAPFRDPRPLPPGVLPQQDPAATADAVRRWLAANPPAEAAGSPTAPAPPVPDLSGARVNLGPVALSPPPPGQGALAGNGGFTPAPPMAPPGGFTPAPDAGRPSVVSTPIPDGPIAPPHTGSPPPAVNLDDVQEEFPLSEATDLSILALQDMPVAQGRKFDPSQRQWTDAATGQPASPPILGTDVTQVGVQVSGRFPAMPQAPNSVRFRLDQAGNVSHYQVWGDDGLPAYRVDVQGAAHGGVPTPHTIHFPRNADPSGQVRANTPTRPIPALPLELP